MTIQTEASTKVWGAHCNGMPAGGIGTPHKCFRNNGCKICNPDFHKKSKGYTQSKAFKNQQVSLELSAVSCDHNYCRICTKHSVRFQTWRLTGSIPSSMFLGSSESYGCQF